ncbi:RNA methyltransferase [Leptothoe spongobia]|uniref:tRNA (cytidine/uridine-2'-O-)-methyltransferase TrmJ n=1 Tax=Leptothoe spongobia TAU-MAC 1115 TaxID=1967444 RepID=A0A947DHU8_9CYAN|nr:RNA methyltransferase [Leptothoe spongobia]MBT9316969.1 RNA methyltransferase [Leptothoe spongobia TAU-MAC 1115]
MSPGTSIAELRIVLVEPAGPLNVGSVARVMKNFGLSQLVLVNPQCDPYSDDAKQMAVHAYEIIEASQMVDSLPKALVGCQRAIATTARSRDLQTPLESPELALPWLLESSPTALIFGPEDRGLNNDEMLHAQRFIKIATRPPYESLNLAQAVAICCYELSRVGQRPQPLGNGPASVTTATLDQLDGYYHHLESILLKIGYLYPHTAPSRMRKFRQLGHRAALSAQDVAMLRGILRQIDWATGDQEADQSGSDLKVP